MGLTYHFQFVAPATVESTDLADFLLGVEYEAKAAGFDPTIVVNAPFDTVEQRQFARRLTTGIAVEGEKLKGVGLSKHQFVIAHDPSTGCCRIGPAHGVLLVVTNERGVEVVFGFFRYPAVIKDDSGTELMPMPTGAEWTFSEFLKSPDPRYRGIIRLFKDAGYLALEHDDYGVTVPA